MLTIAEKCFFKIAQEILQRNLTVRQAFAKFIQFEQIQIEDEEPSSEEVTVLELLSPLGFLEGIKELGLLDLEEIEVACLMRVLTKPNLDNAILVKELIIIMSNFGIPDDDHIEGQSSEGADNSIVKKEKSESKEGSSKKKQKKKKGGANFDMSLLDEKSIKILAKLLLALIDLNVSLYDFFDGAIYEQLVNTKTKQNKVEIIDSKDFFELLQARGIRKNKTEVESLKKFLSIDKTYPNLLMIKKLAKALDEMTKNEELMN